jgi:antitoxin Phd
MNKTWQLQDAKNRLSELVEGAEKGDIQFISKRGKLTAVLLSLSEFQKLRSQKEKKSLSSFFEDSPLYSVDLEKSLDRDKDRPRETEL